MGERTAASRRAYIGRSKLDEFFGYLTDIATGEVIYDEGEWSNLESALAWARARADQVVLTYGTDEDSVFSAGVTYYPGGEGKKLTTWPPSEEVRKAIDAEVQRHEEGVRQADPAQLGVERPMIIRSDKPRRPSHEDKR